MSPKTGRPKVEHPMEEKITVRLDIKSSQKLNKYCEQNQVTKGKAIRTAISKLKTKE